jgi:hypothetical protein
MLCYGGGPDFLMLWAKLGGALKMDGPRRDYR